MNLEKGKENKNEERARLKIEGTDHEEPGQAILPFRTWHFDCSLA